MSEIIIRPAQTADYPSFARLFPELLVGDPVPDAARWRDELLPSSFIAEDGSGVIGYSYFQMIGGTGYIRHVVVAPSARGRGVGERIMAALRQRFRDCGGKTWELNVKPDNHAAIRLYERFGLRPQYRSTALGLPWALVDSLAPAETPVVVRIVQPDEDLRFESALHLIDGQLHSGRVLPGRVIVGLVYAADGAPAGIGIFHPAFPGASPFRVAHPSFVGALLAGMRPYALPDQPLLGLFVEADAAAVAALVTAGATVRLEALHYHGEL